MRLPRFTLLRYRYEGLSPSGASVNGVRNDRIEYRPYCHSEERSDAGISISIMQRNLARGYVSLRGAERRGNLIQFNARIKLRGNLLLVTHIYEYVK